MFPSLCDPFDNEVSAEWRDDFLTLVHCTPALTWLLLTKRIGNARKMLEPYFVRGQPMPNVWLGASVINQAEADRDIPKLLQTPAALRFISYEPALGPIRWRTESELEKVDWLRGTATAKDAGGTVYPIKRIDWVIAGGESAQGGAKARPFVIGWARETMRSCKAAGVPFFMKQFGSNATNREGVRHPFKDRSGSDPAEWPPDLQVQEFPA